MSKSKTYFLSQVLVPKRFKSSFIPEKPTWKLQPLKTSTYLEVDYEKLKKLSMLTIDDRIKKDLQDAINVSNRMVCAIQTNTSINESNLYHQHLIATELRDDDVKLNTKDDMQSGENVKQWRREIMSNAKYTFEDYFLTPSQK